MKQEKGIDSAIVQSKRMDVREALRDCLKRVGINHIHASSTVAQASQLLKDKPQSLLVIDWELGPEVVLETLQKTKEDHKIYTRPILMFAKAPSDQLMGVAFEYHLTKVYTGDISVNRIKDILTQLLKDEKQANPLRNIFLQVAKFREEGNLDKADLVLTQALDKAGNNPKIVAELAENKILQGKWLEAQAILEKIENMDPPFVRAMHLLGRCRIKTKNFEGAIQALSKAKIMNPYNIDRLVLLGQSFLKLDRVAEAKEEFLAAKILDPTNQNAAKGAGQCLLLEGEINDALEVLHEVSDQKELASIFNSSAILAMRGGRFESGITLYDAASDVIKTDTEARARIFFNKGIGYRRWQKDKEAFDSFERALRVLPSYTKARDHYLFLAKKHGLKIADDLPPADAVAVANAATPVTAAPQPSLAPASVSKPDALANFEEKLQPPPKEMPASKPLGSLSDAFSDDFDEDDDDSLAFL